ncbi:MAG: hypothetical protein IT372_35075 [Polyangiaceae bacterium]|nr:hypothetical protein [Polyangiaceae bacterium]
MRLRRCGPVAVALMMMLPLGEARAQSDEDKAAARSLWSQASEALAAGKFEETVDLATRAEALVHAPTHLLLIARAQSKLGRLVAAKESYLKIIREDLPASAPGAFKKAQQEAKDELAAVEPRIASLKVVLEGTAGRKVPVKIDDQPVADALVGVHRPIDPGKHMVVAYPPSLSPVEQTVTLGDGEKKELKLAIPAGPLPPGTPVSKADDPDYRGEPAQPQPPPDKVDGGMSGLTWAGIGVSALGLGGLGLGVAFTVIGAGTQSESDDLFDACKSSGCTPAQRSEIEAKDSDAASQKTIGTIGLIGGGVALAGGVTLLVLGLTSKPAPAKTAWITPYVAPSSFGVHGAF